MKPHGTQWWIEDLAAECIQFQLDLSCLVDGELDELAAAGAMSHLEECQPCRTFLADVRDQVRAHRELADPDALLERCAGMLGTAERRGDTLVERLAVVFYQLGKAYVLAGIDPGFRTRVFERVVQVSSHQLRGRGFVDGVLAGGRNAGSFDWGAARQMLNGRLERIASPLEKGRRLLEEALAADPEHEEARLYVAWLDAHEGKRIRAAHAFRQIFRASTRDENRAHAAVQLGKLLAEEGEIRKAIACNRWVVACGLADDDERFYFARFNVAIYYADLGQPARSLAAFRALLDRHPSRAAEIAGLFAGSLRTRAVIERQPGFLAALEARCPELFASPASSAEEEVTP